MLSPQSRIDRHALVTRHNPRVTQIEALASLAVGNGEFAFGADATGLQTFPKVYEELFPLCTAAQWAWHHAPMPADVHIEDFRHQQWETYGREVPYPTSATGQETLYDWLRENPHKFHLGRIGLNLKRADGTAAQPADIEDIDQNLDLWSGQLHSCFRFDGADIEVETLCHPTLDLLAVRVTSPLIKSGQLGLKLAFPYGSPLRPMANWEADNRHQSDLASSNARGATLRRSMMMPITSRGASGRAVS